MKNTNINIIRNFVLSGIALLATATLTFAAPVVRQGTGANSAALKDIVDLFRADLGGTLNPNNGQSFTTGRRDINWDGVPYQFA
jgi:hypothetical protein